MVKQSALSVALITLVATSDRLNLTGIHLPTRGSRNVLRRAPPMSTASMSRCKAVSRSKVHSNTFTLLMCLSGACYLKDTLKAAHNVTGVLGARLITSTPTPNPSPSPSPSATPISSPYVGSFEYKACYNDSVDDRTLSGAWMYSSRSDALTLDKCAGFCSNFTYFGLEGSNGCFCGQTLSADAVEVLACDLACTGDSTEICGGASALSVYGYVPGQDATTTTTTNVTYGTNATLGWNGTISSATIASATASVVANVNGTSGVFDSTGAVRKHLSRHRLTRHGKGIMNFP